MQYLKLYTLFASAVFRCLSHEIALKSQIVFIYEIVTSMTRSLRLEHVSTFDGLATSLKERAGKVGGIPQRFKDLIQMKTRYPLFMTENLKRFIRNVSQRPFREAKSA